MCCSTVQIPLYNVRHSKQPNSASVNSTVNLSPFPSVMLRCPPGPAQQVACWVTRLCHLVAPMPCARPTSQKICTACCIDSGRLCPPEGTRKRDASPAPFHHCLDHTLHCWQLTSAYFMALPSMSPFPLCCSTFQGGLHSTRRRPGQLPVSCQQAGLRAPA